VSKNEKRSCVIAPQLPSRAGLRVSSDGVDRYGHTALTNCAKYSPRSGVRDVKRSLFALVGGLLGKAFPSNANDEPQLGCKVIQKTAHVGLLLFLRPASLAVVLAL
jgi:hypothetical protein